MLSEAVKISMLFLPYNFCPALCGALFLCPQKQCLSGKEDGLSGRTNQRLPPGGSSRQSRGRESALRYNQYKSKVARAPSVTLRSEPPKLISFASGNPCRVPPQVANGDLDAALPLSSSEEGYVAARLYGKGVRTKLFVLLLIFFWQAKTCFMKALPYVASCFPLLPDPKTWEKEKRDGAKKRAQKAL